MRWPWSRKPDVIDFAESQSALAEARRQHAKAKTRESEVDRVTRETAKHASENHFSKIVEEAMHLRRR